MNEQRRARELRAALERDIPETLDLWPAIRRRAESAAHRGGTAPAWRWRPFAPVLVASLLVAALLVAGLLRPGRASPVGAAAILGQAQAAEGATGLRYHLTATYENAPAGLNWTGDHWQEADGRLRSEHSHTEADGTMVSEGLIDTGSETWFFQTRGGQTAVQRIAQSKAAARGPQEVMPLELWLAGNEQGCSVVRREADTTVAGRRAYVVSIASTGNCTEVGEVGDRSVLWLDQETYLILGSEYYGPGGALRERYTVTAIDYGPVAEGTFAYTPSAGATVCALEATPGYPLCSPQDGGRSGPDHPAPEASVVRAAADAQLALLGLTPQGFKRSLAGGTSLADLSRERGLAPEQLREAMLTAGRARIAALVGEDALTGEAAAEQEQLLVAWVGQQFVAEAGGNRPLPAASVATLH